MECILFIIYSKETSFALQGLWAKRKNNRKSILVQYIHKQIKENRYLKRHESCWNDPVHETQLWISSVIQCVQWTPILHLMTGLSMKDMDNVLLNTCFLVIPENVATSIIHCLRYQTHQPNTSSTIHQVYPPLHLLQTPIKLTPTTHNPFRVTLSRIAANPRTSC